MLTLVCPVNKNKRYNKLYLFSTSENKVLSMVETELKHFRTAMRQIQSDNLKIIQK